MFFQNLMLAFIIMVLSIMVFIPIYVSIIKHKMYDEFKSMWSAEVEAEKRKIAMLQSKTTIK